MKDNFKFTFDRLNQKLAANEKTVRNNQNLQTQLSYSKLVTIPAAKFTGQQNQLFDHAITRKDKLNSRSNLNRLYQREYSTIRQSIKENFVIEQLESKKNFDYDQILEDSN